MKRQESYATNGKDQDKMPNPTRLQRLSKCIDKDMVYMKLTYLLWSGLVNTYTIYFNPFCVTIGIQKHKAGVVTGIPHAVSVIAAPLWGILTDYTGQQQLILIVLCLVSAVWIPSLPLIANAIGISNKITNGNTIFITFIIVVALGSVFFSCVDGYIEAIALNTIKVSPSGAAYGAQRVYGAIGGAIVTYSTGVLLDHVIFKDMSPYAIIFFVYPIFPLLLIPMVLLLIKQQKKWIDSSKSMSDSSPQQPNEEDESIWKELVTLFRQIDVIVFMITVLISGLADSLLYFLVFLINEQMEVSKSKVSLVFSMETISNIVVFFGIERFMKLLGGPIPTMIFSLLCFCIRYMLMSYTKSYWGTVALQGFSGLSFGSIWCAFMEHVREISPNRIKTTMTVVMQCIHFGLGVFLGTTIGGIITSMFDATRLFRWTGMMCGVWSFVLIVYYSFKRYQN